MAFVNIRELLKTKLATVTSIQEVHDFPNEEFNGFPACVIASNRNEAEFEDTIHNERVYVFTLWILQQVEGLGKQKARQIIEEVMDDVIESFDKDQELAGLSLPSNEDIIICYPMLSSIYTDTDGKYVIAEMELKVKVSFNIL